MDYSQLRAERYYPDILAVDPDGCGCTECLVGDYVPLDAFVLQAKTGDIIALLEGEIRNNTYEANSALLLIELNSRVESETMRPLLEEVKMTWPY